LYAYVRALVEADVAVFLIGPTQSGKSYVFRQVIEDLGLSYAEGPLTQGASTSWLLGTWTAGRENGGWVEAPFPRQYALGGGYCFEEGDAAGPDLVVVLNNALTNGELHNPRNGKTITRHRSFRPGMTGNTFGTGAADGFRGRSAQDKAVLERFRMGRLLVGYDRELQHAIFDQALEDALRNQYEGGYR
jgi:MoxR-like ATPase